MRLLGQVTHDADKTTTSNMLMRAAMVEPEIMTMSVMNLFEQNYSTFGSFLGRKGLTSKGLYAGLDSKNFRVVGNRKVQWAIKGYPLRKGNIVSHNGGSTPGLGGAEFTIICTTDWFGENENLELVDRRTLLHVLSKVASGSGQWSYRVKLVANSSTAFCDPTLLTAGKEIGFGHTMYPELSEDGNEKTTYPEWHTEYLGIQRMKYTISGTANAMKLWIEHNGQKMWIYEQDLEMMRRWAIAMEHKLLFGRATIDANDRVYVHDDDGRDLISGNGVLEQGDPGLRMQYNTLSIRHLENIMANLQLMSNGDGVLEVAVCCGQQFFFEFGRLMRDVLQQNPEPLYERGPDGAGIKTAFSWYQFQNVRLNLMWCPAFDAVYRPIERDRYGNNLNSKRAIFVSLGNTVGNQGNVQLIALGNGNEDRTFVQRMINGMTGGGAMVPGPGSDKYQIQQAASPVDGLQVHILSETGVVVKNPMSVAQLIPARRA